VYQPFRGKRETDPLSPDQIREQALNADPQGLLYNYKLKGYTVDYLGIEDIEGVDVHKLRLITKDGDMVYYYMDAESGYLLKRTMRMRFKDKETKNSSVYSDFRKTDYGVIVAHSEQGVDGNGNEQGNPSIYDKVEVNPTYSIDELFKKPTSK
jgi:hypothetical protein